MNEASWILLQTHFLSEGVRRVFEELRAATPHSHLVNVLLHDLHDAGHCGLIQESALRRVTNRDLAVLPYPRIGTKLVPGHAHFLLLHLFPRCPEPDFFWVVENDVRYTGNWQKFFAAFENNDADLLTTYLHPYASMPDWYWWGLDHPEETIELSRCLRGFMPVYRISRRALHLLHEEQSRGWRGHFETLVPTLLARAGMKIEEIGGDGPFTPPERRGRFYTMDGVNPWGAVNRGTFRHRPVLLRPGPEADRLYHPVKEKGARNLVEGALARVFPGPAAWVARSGVRLQQLFRS